MRLDPPLALVPLFLAACGGNVMVDAASTTTGAGGAATSTFACGTTTCAAGFYCEDHPPGIAPPDGGIPANAYTCSPLPASCTSTPTCACLGAVLQGDPCSPSFGAMCTEDASGNVTIVCLDA